MIATRLHAQRKSGALYNRQSISSLYSTSHLHVHSPSLRTSQRLSSDIQSIERASTEEAIAKEARQSPQVDFLASVQRVKLVFLSKIFQRENRWNIYFDNRISMSFIENCLVKLDNSIPKEMCHISSISNDSSSISIK